MSGSLINEWRSIVFLLFLYTLQGIPLGLSGTLDLYLQERSLSFEKQGVFGFATLPFSLKLLWAPLVDSTYSVSIGRRKSWLVPVQLLIGVLLLYTSFHLPTLLRDTSDEEPEVYELTLLFFLFYFLAATQDIAVDGWAVSMLSDDNAGMASTCNSIGQTFGFLLGYTIFLWLDISLEYYVYMFGVFFIASTLFIHMFVKEAPVKEAEDTLTIKQTYAACYKILKLRDVQRLNILFFCYRASFAVFDVLSMRMILQKGLPKESVANFSLLSTIATLLLSGFIVKYTTTNPLGVLHKVFLPRLIVCALSAVLVFFYENNDYYNFLLLIMTLGTVCFNNICFVSFMSYYAQISNDNIGGTSMTLFNTFNNLSGLLPQQASLFLVNQVALFDFDGYYVLSVVSVMIGTFWFSLYGSAILSLDKVNLNKL